MLIQASDRRVGGGDKGQAAEDGGRAVQRQANQFRNGDSSAALLRNTAGYSFLRSANRFNFVNLDGYDPSRPGSYQQGPVADIRYAQSSPYGLVYIGNQVFRGDGVIYTPPIGNSVLWGITRDSVIDIAHDLGFEVREQTLPRETLYIADEVFFTGTAAEVTPVRSVDKIQVGAGRRGPITEALQKAFFQVVNCEVPDTHGWLTWVYPDEANRRQPLQAAAGNSR